MEIDVLFSLAGPGAVSVVRVSRPTEKHTAHGELGRGQVTVLASGAKGASKFVLCRRSASTPPPKRESAHVCTHVTRLCGKVGELEAPLMMDPRETTRTPACYGADSGTVIVCSHHTPYHIVDYWDQSGVRTQN